MSEYTNIFEFTKFWTFLAEYQETREATDPSFTRTEFCNQLGLPLSFLFRWGGARQVSYDVQLINDLEDSRSHDQDYYDLSPYLRKQGDRFAYKRIQDFLQ